MTLDRVLGQKEGCVSYDIRPCSRTEGVGGVSYDIRLCSRTGVRCESYDIRLCSRTQGVEKVMTLACFLGDKKWSV